MKILDENSSLTDVILKINEIIAYINGCDLPLVFDENNIPSDIREYLLKNGGMIK